MQSLSCLILESYKILRGEINLLSFSHPVMQVYNPLNYAWDGFEKFTGKLQQRVRAVFIGMNPGPFGMAQTGVPFGEIDSVKNFLGIDSISINRNLLNEHHDYLVKGLDCSRSEVSGRRLWALFRTHYGDSTKFFSECFVLNYCPLLFLAASKEDHARNLTPDKLIKSDREKLFSLCDSCLRNVIEIISPEFVIGVGNFAESRARESLKNLNLTITKILHPSPASPASNKDWAGQVTRQLINSGVWSE